MFGKNLAGIIIVLIVIIAIVISAFSHGTNYDSSKVKIFIAVLTGLGIFVTFFFYYNVVALQYQQQSIMYYDRVQVLDESFIDSYLKSVEEYKDQCPEIINQMYPCQKWNLQGKDDKVLQFTLATRAYILWKDYVQYHEYVEQTGNAESYVCIFLQQCNSSILADIWKDSKYNYSDTCIKFSELLFEYTPKTEDINDYINASKKLVSDPRYNGLF